MPFIDKEDFDYNFEDIEKLRNIDNFKRFQGFICWKCRKKLNIPIYDNTKYWKCICGETNKVDPCHIYTPFINPDLGPGKELIERKPIIIGHPDYNDEENDPDDYWFSKSW